MVDIVLNKFKHFIDSSSVPYNGTEDFKEHGYIPLGENNEVFYVAMTKSADQSFINSKLNHYTKLKTIKYVQIDEEYFSNILNYIEEKTSPKDALPKNTYQQDKQNSNKGGTPRKKIGEILIEKGFITEDQLFNALVEAKQSSIPIGTILVKKGFITVEELKSALFAQQGYETVNTEQLKIDANVLELLPEDFIKLNKVMPINFDGKTLVIGMVNPTDRKVINEVIAYTSLQVKVMLITHYEFTMCVETYYNESQKETSEIIERIEQESNALDGEETLWEQAERELKDTSGTVVKFVNKIITDAIDQKASDIHIEPRLNNFAVRYRIDGILKEVLQIPGKTESAVITRLKVISKMNIAEHRRPQDGSFSITYKNKNYDFRINTLPVASKEKMVIRILTPAISLSSAKEEINLIGATQEDIERLNKIISVPNGIILATGPTGSGKTTTLYNILRNLNDEKINITTIEDPIEIKIEGVNQSQINTKAGITFASCLRAILRQDPDIILVGEIRDYETLEVAISAALTGHLVLSTLHTNSASSTITRLIEMGAKDYLISSTVEGVIAQRLVRKLCDNCKEQHFPTREEAEFVLTNEKEIEKFMKVPIYKAKGCEKCGYNGFKGRLGVYEIMQVTKEIKRLIAQSAHDIQIEEAAIGAGMKTLQQSCLSHIIKGDTTISEFLRVLGPVND